MCAKEIKAIQSRFSFGRSAAVPPPAPALSSGDNGAAEVALLAAGPTSPLAPKLSPCSMSASPGNALAPLASPDPKEAILLPAKEELSMRIFSEEQYLRASQNVLILREHGDIVVHAAEFLKMVSHRVSVEV